MGRKKAQRDDKLEERFESFKGVQRCLDKEEIMQSIISACIGESYKVVHLYSVNNSETGSTKSQGVWHGTKLQYIDSILRNGLKPSTTEAATYGPGIYSTDALDLALKYVNGSQLNEHTEYRVVLLCSITPGKVMRFEEDDGTADTVIVPGKSIPTGYTRFCGLDIATEFGKAVVKGPVFNNIIVSRDKANIKLKFVVLLKKSPKK